MKAGYFFIFSVTADHQFLPSAEEVTEVAFEDVLLDFSESESSDEELSDHEIVGKLKSTHPCRKIGNASDILLQPGCIAYLDPLLELAHTNIPTICVCGKQVKVSHKRNGSALRINWVRALFEAM